MPNEQHYYSFNPRMKFLLEKVVGSESERIPHYMGHEGFFPNDEGNHIDAIAGWGSWAAICACARIDELYGSEFSKEAGGAGDFGCIIELRPKDPSRPAYRLTVGSQVEQPSNWAKSKLAWLKSSGLPLTAPMTHRALVKVAEKVCPNSLADIDKFMAGICTTKGLSDQKAGILEQTYRIVPFLGAFRCHAYFNIFDKDTQARDTFDGMIYISFSGAKQYRDLEFAVDVLWAMTCELINGKHISECVFDCSLAPDILALTDQSFNRLWLAKCYELARGD